MSSKRRGLGQGLGALFNTETPVESSGLLNLPVQAIERNPQQPRKHFDEERLLELAASIREHGILQPVVVSQLEGGRYQIVAGERRWRAAQLAGLEEIPALVREVAPTQALVLALVENIQRADLDPLEEARAYQALAQEFGLTHQEIGERVGKSRAAVTNALRLLRLPTPVQQALSASDGRLTPGHLKPLLGLDEKRLALAVEEVLRHRLSAREAETLAQLVLKQGLTPAQARETLQQRDAQPRRSRSGSNDTMTTGTVLSLEDQAVEETLLRALGTKVELRRQGRGGRITIWFHSLEELEALYQRLVGAEEA